MVVINNGRAEWCRLGPSREWQDESDAAVHPGHSGQQQCCYSQAAASGHAMWVTHDQNWFY